MTHLGTLSPATPPAGFEALMDEIVASAILRTEGFFWLNRDAVPDVLPDSYYCVTSLMYVRFDVQPVVHFIESAGQAMSVCRFPPEWTPDRCRLADADIEAAVAVIYGRSRKPLQHAKFQKRFEKLDPEWGDVILEVIQ